jgi:Cd2+/Zn2+-exporting ATPase
LIKGGAPLEALGRLDAIAFDKTGTLTIGEPHLVDIVPYGDTSETELLEISAAVEALSDHPLAQAVVEDVKKRLGDNPREATDFANIIGQGVSARVGGELVHIGKTALFDETDGVPLPDDLRARGRAIFRCNWPHGYAERNGQSRDRRSAHNRLKTHDDDLRRQSECGQRRC